MTISNNAVKPTNDYVFKRVFGYEGKENITKDFIKSVTKYEIDNIDISKNTILPKDLSDDKVGILDVRAIINDNIQCDIEMQVLNQDDIEERILYYWSRLYSKSIKEGDGYDELKKTIIILLANFKLEKLKEINKYHTEFKIREKEFCHVILSEVLEIHIIELPKTLMKSGECKMNEDKELEKWVRFLMQPNSLTKEELDRNEALKDAKKILDQIKKDEREEELAWLREKYVRDQNNMISTGMRKGLRKGLRQGLEEGMKKGIQEGMQEGMEKGMQEGMKKGIQEGKKQKQEEIILKLIEEKIEIDKIVKITGYTREEIEKVILKK